jgi:hypothetical protein
VHDPSDESLLTDGARLLAEVIESSSLEERTDPGLLREKVRRSCAGSSVNGRGGARWCCPSSWRSDVPVASALSRRASEFLGVVLFAAAVLWIMALVTYEPSDPAWFFSTEASQAPANFAGRVGAFLAEASFQLLGYASYLVPAVLIVLGWHYFWCQALDAIYTKVVGVAMLFASLSAIFGLGLGSIETGGRPFRAGGSIGEALAGSRPST